jgi:hypothetical protein
VSCNCGRIDEPCECAARLGAPVRRSGGDADAPDKR